MFNELRLKKSPVIHILDFTNEKNTWRSCFKDISSLNLLNGCTAGIAKVCVLFSACVLTKNSKGFERKPFRVFLIIKNH